MTSLRLPAAVVACALIASALGQSSGIEQAKPVERKRMDFRGSVVIATASDGYRAVFSWAELYLSPIGDGVLVVYEREGAPLDDSEGRLALVSLGDTRPGPRYVKWLQSIELRTIE